MTVFDTVAAALQAASAAGVVDTARQGVYQAASGARAAQATAPGMPTIARVYASELLDTNTCQPCAAVDGKEYASVDAAHSEYHGQGGYMGCSGGLRCRGTLVFVYSSETPAGGDGGLPPYTPPSVTPQPNPPAWSPPTLQPAPPPPPGFTGVQINDVYGDKVLVAVRQDGSYVWPQRSTSGKWVGSDGHPLPDDVVRWLDSHPVSKDWKPNWKVNTDLLKPVDNTPKAPTQAPAPTTGRVNARSQRTGNGTNDTGTPVGDALATTNDMTLAHARAIPDDDRAAIRAAWSQGHAVLRPFSGYTSSNNRAALLRSRGAVQALDDAPLLGVDRIWRGMRVTGESMWDNFKALQPGDALDTKGAASFTTSFNIAKDFAGLGRRVIVEYENPRGVALEGITHFQGEHEVLVRGVGRHELVVQSVEYSPDGDTMLVRVTERAFSQFAAPHTERAARVRRAMDYLFKSAKMTYEDGSLFA